MNTWKTANAIVRHLEATIPVYDVSEHGYSLCVSRILGAELRVRDDVDGWAW